MRTLVIASMLSSACGLFSRPAPMTAGDPCVDDPTTSVTVRPTEVRMRPGDRLTFDYEIRSRRGSATAEASMEGASIERAAASAVWVSAPPVPGTYQLVISRVGCPMDRTTATITVEPLQSLGKAPGQQPMAPTGVAFSPDGQLVAATGRGGVWLSRPDGTFVDSARVPHQGQTSVTFSPDGRFLAVGGDVSERTWLLEVQGLKPWTRAGVSEGSRSALFSKDGSELFLHEGTSITAFSVTRGTMREVSAVGAAPAQGESIPRLEHGPLGSLLVTVPAELRELSTGRRMTRWSGTAFAVSPDATWALLGTGLQLPFISQTLTFGGTSFAASGAFSAELTRDGRFLALGQRGAVSVFRNDGPTLSALGGATLMNAPGPVLDVAWSPDGSRLAVAGSNRVLILTRAQLGVTE